MGIVRDLKPEGGEPVLLIDSHAHLDSPKLFDQLVVVLSCALEAGVERILTIGCGGKDPDAIRRVVDLAEDNEQVYAALGVHPHDAEAYNPEVEAEIRQMMSHPKVLAWGEIGLDFFYDNSPRDLQRLAFRRQLQEARSAAKPVIIHSRDAADETCEILEEELSGISCPCGVMHCFSYDRAVADRCLQMGFHLGFGGILTFPRSEELRAVARRVPADRYLIETDSPYLAPVPHRGKTNEPAFVAHVAEKLAEVRGESFEVIAAQNRANFEALFGHG